MDELNILFSHYNTSFEIQLKYLHKRNKYFFYLLISITALLFNVIYDDRFNVIIDSTAFKFFGKEVVIESNILNAIFLTAILWLSLLYFKSILTVDRGFKYIHSVERELNTLTKQIEINREGEFYKKNKTNFSKNVSFIYKYIFPSLIAIAAIIAALKGITKNFNIIELVECVLAFIIVYVVIIFISRKN